MSVMAEARSAARMRARNALHMLAVLSFVFFCVGVWYGVYLIWVNYGWVSVAAVAAFLLALWEVLTPWQDPQ